MIHKTNIYKIEYEKYIFLKRIRILLFSLLIIVFGSLCMKFFARADNTYHDEVLNYSLRGDGTATVTGLYNSSATVINIPEKIHPNEENPENIEYNVTEISPNAFSGSNITEVHGQFIKTIGYNNGNSFKWCTKLTTVDFPNATYIGSGTFYNCHALTSLDLPNATYIGNQTFYECYGLINLGLANAIYVGNKAFYNCSAWINAYLPNTTYIGNCSFSDCYTLKTINLPNATYIGDSAFENCKSLTNIEAPNLIYLHISAFDNFPKAANCTLTIPENMKKFNWDEVINVPNNINYTGKSAIISLTIYEPDNINIELDKLNDNLSKELFGEPGKTFYNFQVDKNYPIKSGSNSKYYAVEFKPVEETADSLTKFSTRFFLIKVFSNVDVTLVDGDGTPFESTKYTGNEVEKPKVKITDGSYTLSKGSDYNLTYDTDFTNAGKKNILVDFIGDYSELNSIVKKFKILPVDASELTVSDIEFNYTGESHNLDSLEITYDGPKFLTLEKGIDYDFINNPDTKNAGEKKLYISFKNNYKGTRKVNIKINPKDASNFEPVCTNPHTYDGSTWNPQFTLLDGNTTLTPGKDYDISIAPGTDMINVGEKKLYISFKNNYKGTREVNIRIDPKNASNFEIKYDKTHFYDGKNWKPQFKITDKDNELIPIKDYEIKLDKDMKEVGVKNVKIEYIGNYSGEKNIQLEIIVDKSSWGKKVTSDEVINYVDDYGKTSAEVNGNEMVWLKESSDGSSAWYAVDNSNGVFRKGSRFWVKWLSPESDKDEFDKYYSQLDENQKNKAEENKLWIFLTGVTDPDGNDYSTLGTPIDYYVQIGDDWDKEDINAVFISEGEDDNLNVDYKKIKSPEGITEFAKIFLVHFSPYAIFDELKDTPAQKNEDSNYPPNEENSRDLYFNKGQLIRSIINYNVDSGLISKIPTWILIILVSSFAFIILKKSKNSK